MYLKHGINDPSPAAEGAEPVLFPPLKLPPGRSAPSPPAPRSTQPPPPPPPAPHPQPPSKVGRPPPAPPKPGGRNQPSYLGPHRQGNNDSKGCDLDGESEAPKTKLKPFFWDKVLANPDQSMVWHEISSGSFQ